LSPVTVPGVEFMADGSESLCGFRRLLLTNQLLQPPCGSIVLNVLWPLALRSLMSCLWTLSASPSVRLRASERSLLRLPISSSLAPCTRQPMRWRCWYSGPARMGLRLSTGRHGSDVELPCSSIRPKERSSVHSHPLDSFTPPLQSMTKWTPSSPGITRTRLPERRRSSSIPSWS
jgi:hypothetical protein